MYFVVLFFLLNIFSYLIIRHSIIPLNQSALVKGGIIVLLFASAWTYPLARIFHLNIPFGLDPVATTSAYCLLGYISFWGLFFFGRNLCLWLTRFKSKRRQESIEGPMMSRRSFLKRGGAFSLSLVPIAPMGVGMNNAFTEPLLVRNKISLPARARGLAGLSAVQISDLHIGSVLRGGWLEKIVDRVNGLQPDIVFITGDLVDGSVEDLKEDIVHLQNIQAPYGVFVVTGNHEFYSGVQSWVSHLRSLGLEVLTNQHRIIRVNETDLLIGGMWDHAGHRFGEEFREDLKATLEGATGYDYSIMLAHQPNSIALSAAGGMDLQLSGHTHSGQYWPFTEVVKLFQQYPKGFYKVEETTLYVNIGTGFWGPPLRLASTNEITHFEFTA